MEIKKRITAGIIGLSLLFSGIGFQMEKTFSGLEERLEKEGLESENESEEWAGAVKHLSLFKGPNNREDVFAVERQLDKLALTKRNSSYKTATLEWDEMGPDNQGGRTYDIIVDKDNSKIYYTGSASGGVFKSTNSGASWFKSGGDSVKNLAVRCMIQSSNGDIYYGTGEFSQRFGGGDLNSGMIGRGIFKSSDRGATFTQLKATDPASPYSKTSTWDYIHTLAFDPNVSDGKTIYAGTDDGIMVTTDGGATWKALSKANSVQSGFKKCSDLKISKDGKLYLAAMQSASSLATIVIRSDDGGATWTRVGNTTGVGTKISTASPRIEIAISPSNSNIAYLSSAKTDNTGTNNFKLEGIYKSTDKGVTWEYILEGGSPYLDPFIQGPSGTSPQGDYDNAIAVDPFNEDRIFVGGVHLYEGKKATSSSNYQWRMCAVLNYDADNPSNFYNRYYIHADKHGISFDDRTKTMFVTCDGGVFKSEDFSTATDPSFKEINNGYSTIQFYACAVDPYNWDFVIGGTQDNGTLQVNRGGITKRNSESIKGGDGGYTAISKILPGAQFAESQYGSMQRSVDGKSFYDFDDEIPADTSIKARNGLSNKIGSSNFGSFVTPFRLWEELRDTTIVDPVTKETFKEKDKTRSMFVFALNDGLYLSREMLIFSKLPAFYKIADYTNSREYSMTLEIAPEGDVLYYASRNVVHRISGLQRYREFKNGKNFSFDAKGYGIKDTIIYSNSSYPITGIGVNPTNGNEVVITVGGYGNTSAHVLYSNNAKTLANFKSIQKNLPNFPVYDAEINFQDNKQIVIGSEYGIWSIYDFNGSGQWEENNAFSTTNKSGMPRVPVFMLKQMDFNDNGSGKVGPVFYAATHGRGFYSARNLVKVGIEDNAKNQVINTSVKLYPNPVNDFANVEYYIGRPGEVKISIYDLQGKSIESFNLGNQNVGDGKYKINVQNFKNGTYFLRLSTSGIDKVVKFNISK